MTNDKKLKAILFDLDGTLINSEHFYCDSWNEILADWGGHIDFNDWLDNYAGVPVYQNVHRLIARYGITTPYDELLKRREQISLDRFKNIDVLMMPYALDIIQFFADKGLTMAIVTSSIRRDVDAIFERNGLSHYFKLIITRSEITNGKPHPEGYNTCREILGFAKEECLVFEDTFNGLTAAKAAGLVCYAVQSNTAEHDKLIAADKIFLDFGQVKEYLMVSGQL